MRSPGILSSPLADVVVAALAAWRLTHLLWAEDGPWNIFTRMRILAGTSFAGQVLDCFYCLSIWVALPIAFWAGSSWPDRAVDWMAISGAAILLERLTSTPGTPAAAAVWREGPLPPQE